MESGFVLSLPSLGLPSSPALRRAGGFLGVPHRGLGAGARGRLPAGCWAGRRQLGGPQGDALHHWVGAELSAGQGEAGAGWPLPPPTPDKATISQLQDKYATSHTVTFPSRRAVMRESAIPSPCLKGVLSKPLNRIIIATCLATEALRPFTGGGGERETGTRALG